MNKEVYNKIMFLCKEISTVEWSGVLFYNITGSIRDLSKFSVDLVDILLMDKGNATYTEYNFDEDVAGYMMDKMIVDPNFSNIKLGHIHSHNKMAVFFSGTDMDELYENCVNHNFYLSLIVNNLMEMEAKLVYHTTCVQQREFTAKDEKGEEYKFDLPGQTIEYMMEHGCIIDIPFKAPRVDQGFKDRLTHILDKSNKKFEKKEEPKVAGFLNESNQTLSSEWVHTKQGWVKKSDFVKNTEAHNVKVNHATSGDRPSGFPKNNNQGLNDPFSGSEHTFEGDTKPLNQYFDPNDLEDRRIDVDELFTCYLLRLGVKFPNDNIEEAADYLASEGMTGDKFCQFIMPDFGKLYNKFYNDMSTVDMDDFLTTIENVIMFLEEFEAKYTFLPKFMEEMTEFSHELENSWRNRVALGSNILIN